jgi:DNA polymerase-3 subunit epsilon
MNRIIFFDVETTGLIDFKADLLAPHQPRIVQLAAILTEADGTVVDEMNVLIKPDGWTMPEEVIKIHGITTERCEAEGIPMPEALARFNGMKARRSARAAFNISFDKRLLAREAGAYGIEHNSEGIESFCVMQMAKPLCKIPAAGKKGMKAPNLREAYNHFFGQKFEGGHDAMADVLAAKAIFFEIRELEAAEAAA